MAARTRTLLLALAGASACSAPETPMASTPASEASAVVDGIDFPLTIPSGSQSGLKLNHDFEIARNVEHELRLDVDAEVSIHLAPQGYRLVPVIDVDYFGPIGGGEG